MSTNTKALLIGLILIVLFAFIAEHVYAAGNGYIHPTYPGTTLRDYSKPSYRIDGNMVYPTYPGTTIRDYGKPGYRFENDLYQPKDNSRNCRLCFNR